MSSQKAILFLLTSSLICCAHAKPIVIAHRGASGYLPEHSLPAVAAAHAMDVDFIEQDVVLSKDNIPVILHDIHLETVTDVEQVFPNRKRKNGRYFAVDFTLKELKSLRLHERAGQDGTPVFKGRFPMLKLDSKIPTLEEEIQLIQGMNKSRGKEIGIYVELKKPKFHQQEGHPIIAPTLKVLKKYGYTNQEHKAYLQCFDPNTTKQLSALSGLQVIQLIGLNAWGEAGVDYEKMMTAEGLRKIAAYADGIGPYLGYFLTDDTSKRDQLVREAKQLKLKIHAYTFRRDQLPEGFSDLDSLIRFFNDLGIDGYFADHPDLVKQALE